MHQSCRTPVWLKSQPILGNLAGSAVIFGTTLGLIMREHVDLERLAQACIGQGVPCFPVPSAFARDAIYAFIALFEVMILFSVSLKVEGRSAAVGTRRNGADSIAAGRLLES